MDAIRTDQMSHRLQFTTSPLTGFSESALDDIHRLIRDQENDLVGEGDTDRAEIVDMISGPQARPDLGRAAWIEDRVVAVLFVEIVDWRRDVGLDLHVDRTLSPAMQREVLLRLLLEAEVDIGHALDGRDLECLSGEPNDFAPQRWQVFCAAFAQDRLLTELLQDEGFERVRVFERLRMDAVVARSLPAPGNGGGVRVASATESELTDVHAILKESFRDHWGDEVPASFDDWWRKEQASPFQEPDRIFLAHLDGAPVGACVMKSSRRQDGYDYVDMLGVRRSARGRGVARALLRHVFSQAERLDLAGTELDVDSVSPTGADQLYRSMGMYPVRLVNVYLRNLGVDADGVIGWSD